VELYSGPPIDLRGAVVLVVALLVIGWGFGLALALGSVGFLRAPHWSIGMRASAIVLAAVIATSASYGYAVVLDAVGVIEYCDPFVAAAAC
jgi:hypothetical protein